MKLLEEVKVHSETLRELRKEELRCVCGQYCELLVDANYCDQVY